MLKFEELSSSVKIHVSKGCLSDLVSAVDALLFGTMRTAHNLLRPNGDVICANIKPKYQLIKLHELLPYHSEAMIHPRLISEYELDITQ